MATKKQTKPKAKPKKASPKKKKTTAKLPFCTLAPSAEHYRAHDEDEPCDDNRGKK
jgi:hypothetical protein